MSKSAGGKKQATLSRFFTPTKQKPIPKLTELTDNYAKRDFSGEDSAKKRLKAEVLPANDEIQKNENNLNISTIVVDDHESGVGVATINETIAPTPARKTNGRSSARAPKGTRAKLTPLEQQFKTLKAQNMDKVLAYQVGYKFKFFGQDAVVASHLLNIMLIPGNISLEDQSHDRFAYCLIPDSRLHVHLQRLLNNGLKVGVVKQTETAAVKSVDGLNKSGLFERKITGIYTKGTYMGDELFTGDPTINRSNNADYVAESSYILCIDELNYPNETAIVAVQPVTGDIVYDTFSDTFTRDQLESRLAYLTPSEVVIVGTSEAPLRETKLALKLHNPSIALQFKQRESVEAIQANLVDFFQSLDISGRLNHLAEYYTLNFPISVQSCIDQLVKYLAEFKLSSVFTIPENFTNLTDTKKYMLLPINTLRALDIFQVQDDPGAKRGTLLWLLNHTHTRKGLSLLRDWISKPLIQRDEILTRAKAVMTFKSETFVHLLDAFKNSLLNLGKSGVDLDRCLIKVHYSSTYRTDKISRKEFYIMIKSFNDILQLFQDFGQSGLNDFKKVHKDSELLVELFESIFEASKDNIAEVFLKQIDAANALEDKDLSKQKIEYFKISQFPEVFPEIQNELNEIATIDFLLSEELSEIRTYLKRPQLSYVTVLKDTHLIEVRNGKAVDALPSDWLKISGTKSVSRFRPPKVVSLHKRRMYHSEKLLKECDESFNRILQDFDSHYIYFKNIVHRIATFDCLYSLAKATVSETNLSYTVPKFVDEQVIDIKDASHPIILKLGSQNMYVPNDVNLSYLKQRVMIITGPNMGGKSSYVKQIALIVIMAQIGCPIPCSEATMGIFDLVFVRIGASDDILKGKSTFMVEMLEAANIVNLYSEKSLVIMDEIGRGTGTVDGISLAHSILKYVIEDKMGPLTLFITHYPSLHTLEDEYQIVKNSHMAFLELKQDGEKGWPEVVFLFKLVDGVVSNLYGLNVANLAGIDPSIIKTAHEVSEEMKKELEVEADRQWLNQLDFTSIHNLLNSL